ncbi:alpha-adducin-like [Paramacrobiotus metropolitanus]|uniref:alpha-adducin-like n=1 Tax=Paramacrobiotus metropolitanus TaxID=2943436 RepID=UPI002445D013|nr:alpha-adducin-like [Paramacrobiotus metropolitanus]XP_055344347.1 alpha-adducin-like [Paramacrobiotus metropolitanus]
MTEHMNGKANGHPPPGERFMSEDFDPEDPEYVRQLQRPADVAEDLEEMKRRERVTAVLKSAAFRDELEAIIQDALNTGCNPTSLLALQQISELVLPQNRFNQAGLLNSARAPRGAAIIPIADIRGVDSLNYTKGEKLLRCKLAALYRLIDLLGWSEGIYNHVTVRVSQEHDHFLINPFGMLYSEVTASSLVKVHLNGDIVDNGSTTLGINLAGYLLHSAIHGARPDLKCVIHFHTPVCAAVSSMKCGLLPISQEAAIVGEVSYHDYGGILVDERERDLIIRNLGPFNKVMILRNHGVVACGQSIEEALFYAYKLHVACETQVKAMASGIDNLTMMSEEARKQAHQIASRGGAGVDSASRGEGRRQWKIGELEFEAWMRWLDGMGYKTGYVYRSPLVRADQSGKPRANQDVEVPPTASSFAYGFDDDKFGALLKELMIERKKAGDKVRWLNTPNAYQKVEILETGTNEPKKITKWVSDPTSPSPGGTPIRVGNLQFSPAGTSAKEFKQKQQQMKERRNQGIISSGPESRVLEGLTWDEAEKMPDALVSGQGDRLITVGAVSKGIIRRDQQHNVGAYKSQYQRNPFDSATPEEVDAYLLEVEQKKRTGHPDDGYEVRLSTPHAQGGQQQQQPRAHSPRADAHSASGPVIPPAGHGTHGGPTGRPRTPPAPRSEVTPNSAFTRSKSDRFGKVDRAGTYPFRKAPPGLRTDSPGNGERGHESADEDLTGSEPQSPASQRGMKKSDTLDSGELEGGKKKKKKGFRIPSFSLGRKKSRDSTSSSPHVNHNPTESEL